MRRLLAILVGFALTMGAQATASAATGAGLPTNPGAVADVAPLAVWTDWDGNHITSAANCEARRQYISRTYNISLSSLRRQRRNVGLPPCTLWRWILQVRSVDSLARPHDPVTVAASAAALC
ncbi:hypothetical protein ACN27G_03440 [Plantactinospora sp. WMMB334]|uniref:hypothetical protein n=1 Tax=Plantactinospora sp. WMMB334 TaxID=3404119 RepID=UPI003B94A18E